MEQLHSTRRPKRRQVPSASISELAKAFENLDASALLDRLWKDRWRGRHGYPLQAMWQAYVASFILNLDNTNALVRRLEDDPDLRQLCGFGDILPHRTTFNRFIRRVSHHPELVERVFAKVTNDLKALLPDLGAEVAIDATMMRTHANPHKKTDPDATWKIKNSHRTLSGKGDYYGYALHGLVDANHGVALGMTVTTAKRNDILELSPVLKATQQMFSWFRPTALMADKGYDSKANHEYLNQQGILPIIALRRSWRTKNNLHEGIYTSEGVPTCIGMVPMKYVRSDPEKGYLYRCAGCHLKGTSLFNQCNDEVWEDPKTNLRLFGAIRRDGPEWKALYNKRQTVERTFKSLQQSRRLEKHCVRGLRQITLHTMMSVLTHSLTILGNLQNRHMSEMRWMVRKVA